MCKMESIRKTLRDKKKSTVYILQDFEERGNIPPFHANISYIT